MNKTEALKEILRIIQWNGGLNQGQEIKIDYNCGLWRIEKLAEDALSKKKDASKLRSYWNGFEIEEDNI